MMKLSIYNEVDEFLGTIEYCGQNMSGDDIFQSDDFFGSKLEELKKFILENNSRELSEFCVGKRDSATVTIPN